jgi:hypothetical protein
MAIAGAAPPAAASRSPAAGAVAQPGPVAASSPTPAASTTAQSSPVPTSAAANPATPPAGTIAEPGSIAGSTAPAAPASERASRLVIGGSLGLNLGLYPEPSLEASLFLGGALPGIRTPGGWIALGYQGSAGVGRADWIPLRATNGLYSEDYFRGIFVHRHHLAVQGATGREGRTAFGAGFGLVHAGSRGVGLEGDARLGYVFTRAASRLQGSVGGQVRVTGVFGELPQPQLGLFLAITRAPVAAIAIPPGSPRRGVVLMTVGGLLFTGAALAGGYIVLEQEVSRRAGDSEVGYFGVLIAAALLSATAIAGITCVAIGGVQHKRYRQWRARQARLEMHGAGLAF